MPTVSTCLWFDSQALEAATFYTGIFPNSQITDIAYYPEGAPAPAGSVLSVQFSLDGSEYLALNGGPVFKLSPAVSLMAYCATQEELDTRWRQLTDGGQESQCGWLTDRYGLSWQVLTRPLLKLLDSADPAASQRAWAALLAMRKIDLAAVQRAYDGA